MNKRKKALARSDPMRGDLGEELKEYHDETL
jgi:hypothetical protein